MKWHQLSAGLLAGSIWLAAPLLSAQDAVTAAAEREEREANAKRMSSRMELLEESLQAQQRKMGSLVEEIHALREEVDRLKSRGENTATQEKVRLLADKIEEVDRKRQADNELTVQKLNAISKGISKSMQPRETPPPAPKPEKPTPPTGGPAPEKAYAYQLKENQTLSGIVTELRAQGYKITLKQLLETNPGIDPKRLRKGQTIFIPPPQP